MNPSQPDVEARLGEVYGAATQVDLINTYDQWATSYDEDMLGLGYAHPAIICGLTSRYVQELTAPILDVGVGTGAIGTLLGNLGFSNLHGLDMSEAMLERAKLRGCYSTLTKAVLGQNLPLENETYSAIISTGTFTKGHAPASAFTELARILKPGGFFIFTLGTDLWASHGFEAQLAALPSLKPIWQTAPYHPMPFSKTENHYTTRAHIYQKSDFAFR